MARDTERAPTSKGLDSLATLRTSSLNSPQQWFRQKPERSRIAIPSSLEGSSRTLSSSERRWVAKSLMKLRIPESLLSESEEE